MIDTIRALHERGLTILLVEQNVGVAAACRTGACAEGRRDRAIGAGAPT